MLLTTIFLVINKSYVLIYEEININYLQSSLSFTEYILQNITE